MGQGLDKDIANARLIAAAPELLETCKTLLAMCQWAKLVIKDIPKYEQYKEALDKAKQVIAKAEGGAE